jgi:hypothetical protein
LRQMHSDRFQTSNALSQESLVAILIASWSLGCDEKNTNQELQSFLRSRILYRSIERSNAEYR